MKDLQVDPGVLQQVDERGRTVCSPPLTQLTKQREEEGSLCEKDRLLIFCNSERNMNVRTLKCVRKKCIWHCCIWIKHELFLLANFRVYLLLAKP